MYKKLQQFTALILFVLLFAACRKDVAAKP